MRPGETQLAAVKDRLGRTVVLTQERWDYIVAGHDQLDGYEEALMRAVETAEKRREGNFSGAEVLYGEDLGPARHLAVVVAALASAEAVKGAKGQPMTLTLGAERIDFDKALHDEAADVLYLAIEGKEPETWEETPEGHVLRFDNTGELCGVTIIGFDRLRKASGVTVTLPQRAQLVPDGLDFATALAAFPSAPRASLLL